jgi:hypothetical protein
VNSEELSGRELRNAIRVSRAAVDNYGRFTDGPSDMLAARFALLEAIEADGVFSLEPPSWMSSAKPGVEAYVHLNACSLTLGWNAERDRWEASNCIASRRRPGRSAERTTTTTPSSLSAADVEQLLAVEFAALLPTLSVSEHLRERLEERAGIVCADTPAVKALLAAADCVVSAELPGWADANRDNPVMLFTADRSLAFPITRDHTVEGDGYVLTTCVPQAWAIADLERATERVRFTGAAVRAWAERQESALDRPAEAMEVAAAERGQARFVEAGDERRGAVLELDGNEYLLQPLRGGRYAWKARPAD